jgi:hypothetical protein
MNILNLNLIKTIQGKLWVEWSHPEGEPPNPTKLIYYHIRIKYQKGHIAACKAQKLMISYVCYNKTVLLAFMHRVFQSKGPHQTNSIVLNLVQSERTNGVISFPVKLLLLPTFWEHIIDLGSDDWSYHGTR